MRELRGQADFGSARVQALFAELNRLLRGRSSSLVSFEEVRRAARLEGQSDRGIREIPIDRIRGSEGRTGDFDASFLPVKPHLRKRWAHMDAVMRRGEPVPPIEVYQLGETYFVKDGHHRVSVAHRLGRATIPAHVIQVETRAPLAGDLDAARLLQAREYAEFLEKTRLDRLRPNASIECGRLGRYDQIYEHILGHQYFLGLEQGKEVPLSEAVASWYDRVYSPVTKVIHEHGIVDLFPDRTEADLYLWVTSRWLELSKAGRDAGPAEALVDILASSQRRGPSPRKKKP